MLIAELIAKLQTYPADARIALNGGTETTMEYPKDIEEFDVRTIELSKYTGSELLGCYISKENMDVKNCVVVIS